MWRWLRSRSSRAKGPSEPREQAAKTPAQSLPSAADDTDTDAADADVTVALGHDQEANGDDVLSNNVVRYRGISVAAVKKLAQDVLDQVAAPGVQLLRAAPDAPEGALRGHGVPDGITLELVKELEGGEELECKLEYTGKVVRVPAQVVTVIPRDEWTTENVCTHVVLPATLAKRSFYLDEVDPEHVGAPFKGTFVSQARKARFTELVSAIELAHPNEADGPSFVWLDVFSANQPLLCAGDAAPASVMRERYDVLTTGLHEALARFERRIIFLDNLDNPAPLGRAWCVWEVYGASERGKTLEVALSDSVRMEALQRLRSDFESLTALLSNVDMQSAQCHDPSDLEMIHAAVAKIKGGFPALDRLVVRQIQEGLVNLIMELIPKQRRIGLNTPIPELRTLHRYGYFLNTLTSTSRLLESVGKVEEALELQEEAAAIRRERDEANGEDKIEERLESERNICVLLSKLNRNDEVEKRAAAALALVREHLGPRSVLEAKFMDDLADVKQGADEYEAAIELRLQALEILRDCGTRKELIPHLFSTANTLQILKRNEEAVSIFQECVEALEAEHGSKHPDYALGLQSLGGAKLAVRDGAGALECFEQARPVLMRIFGPTSKEFARNLHWTSISNAQIATPESYARSKTLLDEALPLYVTLFGEDSALTARVRADIVEVAKNLAAFDAAD